MGFDWASLGRHFISRAHTSKVKREKSQKKRGEWKEKSSVLQHFHTLSECRERQRLSKKGEPGGDVTRKKIRWVTEEGGKKSTTEKNRELGFHGSCTRTSPKVAARGTSCTIKKKKTGASSVMRREGTSEGGNAKETCRATWGWNSASQLPRALLKKT